MAVALGLVYFRVVRKLDKRQSANLDLYSFGDRQILRLIEHISYTNLSLPKSTDNQRNGLETWAKALMTSVIEPNEQYFDFITRWLYLKSISGLCTYMSMQFDFSNFSRAGG